jgi:hypothetical protein
VDGLHDPLQCAGGGVVAQALGGEGGLPQGVEGGGHVLPQAAGAHGDGGRGRDVAIRGLRTKYQLGLNSLFAINQLARHSRTIFRVIEEVQ